MRTLRQRQPCIVGLLLAAAGVADAAALRVVGVPRSAVMVAVVRELAVVLGSAALAGILAGSLAQWVVLRTITLGYADDSTTPALVAAMMQIQITSGGKSGGVVRPSTGLMGVGLALASCARVSLFGFGNDSDPGMQGHCNHYYDCRTNQTNYFAGRMGYHDWHGQWRALAALIDLGAMRYYPPTGKPNAYQARPPAPKPLSGRAARRGGGAVVARAAGGGGGGGGGGASGRNLSAVARRGGGKPAKAPGGAKGARRGGGGAAGPATRTTRRT